MIRVIFLLLFIIASLNCIAQQPQSVVSGQIVDEKRKESISYTTITITTKEKGDIVTGTMSDENGRFSFSGLHQGEYNVNVSYVGYESKTVGLLIGELNTVYNLGRIELIESTTLLDEIQVVGQRQLINQSLDKKSFDISNNISQSGGSILAAMGNLPGVSVDQEGKVLLRGSDKVAVFTSTFISL